MSTVEMERQKLLSEYRVSNEEKVNDALRLQGSLRRDQERMSILSSATGLSSDFISGLAGKDLHSLINASIGSRAIDSKGFSEIGLTDHANDLKNIADDWEKIYKTIVSASTVKDGVLIQLFDPTLEENAELIERILSSMKDAKKSYGEAYLTDLTKQLADAGKSTYDLALKRLVIEQKISEEAAKQAMEIQKQIDYITNGYDIMGEIMISIDDALRSIRSGNGGYGQYAGAKFAEAGMNSIQGSDAGNFAQGAAAGGWLVGLINMLIGAITKVMNSIEGADEVLNPITNMLMETKDVLKSALLPGLIVSRLLVELGKGLNWLLNILSFGIMGQLADTYDLLTATNDERQREEEQLRALNEQYARLFDALKKQEEYYLQQRRHLNAEWAIDNFQNVNDMILSPHGVFSTNPKDYIIATKHPETLMSGGVAPVYINIENTGAKVSAQESTSADGARQIQITVEAVVQQGILNGTFDGAFDSMSLRRSGRRITA